MFLPFPSPTRHPQSSPLAARAHGQPGAGLGVGRRAPGSRAEGEAAQGRFLTKALPPARARDGGAANSAPRRRGGAQAGGESWLAGRRRSRRGSCALALPAPLGGPAAIHPAAPRGHTYRTIAGGRDPSAAPETRGERVKCCARGARADSPPFRRCPPRQPAEPSEGKLTTKSSAEEPRKQGEALGLLCSALPEGWGPIRPRRGAGAAAATAAAGGGGSGAPRRSLRLTPPLVH